MSNENKNTYVRRGERQCSHIDNQTVSSVQDSTKPVVRDSGHNLQEVSTNDSTLTKKNMIMTSMKGLCSLKDAIIENGIKYILYLLYFYLFDATSSIFLGSKKHIKAKHIEPCNKNHEKKNKWKQINQKSNKKKMENNNSNGRPLTKLGNAKKDSDSFRNQSSNGSNVTAINMPLNCKNIESSILYTALKKPTDISTEQHSFDKTQSPINISQDTESCANEQSDVIRNKSSKSHTKKQRSNFSANEGNARIFKQKCASSDNMHSSSSFPRSSASGKCGKLKQNNFFYNSKYSDHSLINPCLKKNETEQQKKLSIKFAPTNKMKNLTFDKEKNEKHTEQRNKKETQEKKCSFRRRGPTKYKSYYSRIPMGNKESKQNNLKYKEASTQTDSAFSTGNDVRMVSVGTMCPEQQFHECATHKSQDRDMSQEFNYIAGDEISEEKLLSVAYQIISSNSTSSSSTDLSFDEHASAPPHTNIAMDIWATELLSNINTIEPPIRPPPGFPEIPQNPPLTPYIYNLEHLTLSTLEDDYDPNSHNRPVTAVPPAPPPMQHLYYNYAEFMKLPTCSNSSNVLF